ncbi:FLYWCH zinc finger domain-containing protein [Phthorimaea operculella]|nr:FLYWCH zinc finger domain-containing protein [Phthorimaea operculella]
MYSDYTYYCKKQCKKSKLFDWYCSTHNYKGCNAKLKLSENFAVMGETSEHTHPPAKYYFELVPLSTGKYLLRVGDNTFSTNDKDLSGKSTWYCSKRIRRKCRASVKMLGQDIVHINGDHSH